MFGFVYCPYGVDFIAHTAITPLDPGPSTQAAEMNSQNDAIELIQLYVQYVQRAFSCNLRYTIDHTLEALLLSDFPTRSNCRKNGVIC